ncbi:MAG: MerR family transcriptional regulator, partial [Frankiaceae bacterium]
MRLEPGGEPGQEPDEVEAVYTIDELAALARIPVRTVRHYQSQKVLRAPVRQGRIAVYRREHLQR